MVLSEVRRLRRMIWPGFFLALFLVSTVASAGVATITMKDLLNAERIGSAQLSPDASAYAFVRGIPIAKQNSWGYGDADSLTRSRVFVVAHVGSRPKEIPNTKEVRYSLVPGYAWSPDGHELVLKVATPKGVSLATYDRASGEIKRLPGYVATYFPLFDWTGDGQLIYYVHPEGVPQSGANRQVLKNVNARWNAAWYGDKAQTTVSSTSVVFTTSKPPPGALMLADAENGSVHKIATGNYYAISVSPDNRYVAAIRGAERVSNAMNYQGERGELQIFSLSVRGEANLLYQYRDVDVSAMADTGGALQWSSKGNRLLVVGTPVGGGRADAHLYVDNIGSGQLVAIASTENVSFSDPRAFGWGQTLQIGWMDGTPVSVVAHKVGVLNRAPLRHPSPGGHHRYGGTQGLRFDVYTFGAGGSENLTAFSKTPVNEFIAPRGGSGIFIVAGGSLWRLALGQKPVRLTRHGSITVLGFGLDRRPYPKPSPRTAYFRAGTRERVSLSVLVDGKPRRAVLDVRSGVLTPLDVRGRIVSTSTNQLETLSEYRKDWVSTLFLNNRGGERTVLTVNVGLKNKAVAKAESFKFSYEGQSLIGWVVLPPNARLGEPLPAIESVYGGSVFGTVPPAQAEPGYFIPYLSGQLLATQGYAVIYPSTPVGSGSGTNVMSTLAGEAVAAVDALAARGIIDPKRVGVMGQSFGGYSTAAILAERSDRFRAGVAMAGVYDWMFGYGMLPMNRLLSNSGDIFVESDRLIEAGQIDLGKPFWRAKAAYIRNSPIYRVEDINAPLLLLHGDLDLGVTGLPGAIRMYNALMQAGKTGALVRYWGEGHVMQSGWAIRDQWVRIANWFDYYLKHDSVGKKPN